METIFENIGFKISCEDDVYKLADYVLSSGKVLPLKDGAYSFWTDESGAQIWLRLAHDHEKKTTQLLNIDPHYQGLSPLRLRVREELEGEGDDFLDGKYLLETLDGSQFFAVRIMGVKALRDFKVGGEYDFQLTMIPHGIKFFESENAYRTYYNDEKTVLGALFPRGVYSRRLGGDGLKREEILMTGYVGEVGYAELKHVHAASGGEQRLGNFWHLRCETLAGYIDIPSAAEPDMFEHVKRCMEGGEAVVSVFGTLSALVVVRAPDKEKTSEDV